MLRLVELSEEILQQIAAEGSSIYIQNSEDPSTIYCLMNNKQCVGTYILKRFSHNNLVSKAEVSFEIFRFNAKCGARARFLFITGDPSGNRTRVTAVRGRCPRPLDDGTIETSPLII